MLADALQSERVSVFFSGPEDKLYLRASNHAFESPVEIDTGSDYLLRRCFDSQRLQAVQETEPHKSVLLTFGTSSVFNVKNLVAVPIQAEPEGEEEAP